MCEETCLIIKKVDINYRSKSSTNSIDLTLKLSGKKKLTTA